MVYSKKRAAAKKAPSMAKAKRMVTNQRKLKAKKNMDTYFLKCKTLSSLTPTQGVSVSNYVYNIFSMDPTGPYAGYISNAEFNLWRLQYDKFRVNSVKITVTPKANVLDLATGANNDASFNLTGDGMVHTCVDRDGAAPSSTAIISRYPSYRKYSVLKPFSRTYSIKYPTGIWVDCDKPGAFTLAKELGLTGGITIYAENVLEDNYEAFNEPWAQVVVEYNIVFQGKTSNSLSGVYDGSGNLVGVTINAVQEGGGLAVTPLTNIRGTFADTRTTDEVTEVPIDDKGVEVPIVEE